MIEAASPQSTGPATRYVAFDTETTGLSPVEDRIIELAAVSFGPDGAVTGSFEQLVDPGQSIAPALTAIHGIDDSMVAGAPRLEIVMPGFLEFIEGAVLVAHNAPYDIAMLLVPLVRSRGADAAPGNRVLDTCALARILMPDEPSYRLESLAKRLGLVHARAHRAEDDVAACQGLFLRLVAAAGGTPGPDALAARAGSRLRFGIQAELLDRFPAASDRLTRLRAALRTSARIAIEYRGGTKGEAPRQVTPVMLQEQDGVVCLLANCHIDGTLKSFRVDRIGRISD